MVFHRIFGALESVELRRGTDFRPGDDLSILDRRKRDIGSVRYFRQMDNCERHGRALLVQLEWHGVEFDLV